MFQSRLQLHVNWFRGRLSKQPGDDAGRGRSAMQRCARAVTVQSTLVLVLLLVGTLLVLDSYKWRRLALPWYTAFPDGSPDAQELAGGLMPPPAATSPGDGRAQTGVKKSPEEGSSRSPATSELDTAVARRADSPPPPLLADAPPQPSTAIPLQSPSPPPIRAAEPPPLARVVKTPPLPLTSLEKLELGLRQARGAIRNVLLAGAKGTRTEGSGVYEPHGDLYRNAATFRQSYAEMERRFKVFAYPEGEEPLVHNGPCKEIYAIEGRFIQELQGENPFLTSDPAQAHVFFLPFSVSMMVTFLYEAESGNVDPLQHFVQDYVDVVVHKYPFWNQSGGADHFMLSCHDWGPAVTRANPDLAMKSIRVLCNANTSEGYVPWKDASLPEINLVGGNIPADLGGPPPQERPHLAFFAGRDHGPVRPVLFKHWEAKDDDVRVFRSLPPDLDYHDLMKRSRFCLCPGGYEVNSPRIVESIYNECVPVIIADSFVLPFSDVLNWQSFAVHVKEDDIPNLKAILQGIPLETYTSMQENVKQVQRHFLLHQPPERYDVFHMILHSVWLRRLNIRIESS